MHSTGSPSPDDRGRPALDFSRLRAQPLSQRKHLVSHRDFARPVEATKTIGAFLDSIPGIAAGTDLRSLAEAVAVARRHHREVVAAMGASVLTAGCSPLLVDLIDRGIVTAVATNGAGAIHDYELSLVGETLEDVHTAPGDGSFGMVEETAKALGLAFKEGARTGHGIGRYLGELILSEKNPHAKWSVLAAAARKGIPATVHVAVGTDTVHAHPVISGMALGESSLLDYRILCGVVSRLEEGVWLNLGSAIMLPEIFAQAVGAVRNLGHAVSHLTEGTLAIHPPARSRPEHPAPPSGLRSIALTGHHEIMIPLLRAAILCEMED
jgi:hypothetical protein